MNRLSFLTLFMVLACFAVAVNAQPIDDYELTLNDELTAENSELKAAHGHLKDRVRRCSEEIDRVDRLVCYDELAEEMGFVTSEKAERQEEKLATVGFWTIARMKNAVGENIIYLKNNSVEPLISDSGMTRHPTLTIKCKNAHTDVYIDWKKKMIVANRPGIVTQNIAHQFDANERIVTPWEISIDRQAMFAPEPVEFVKEMRQHNRLIFQLTPLHDRSYTFIHDVSGLSEALKYLVKECYR